MGVLTVRNLDDEVQRRIRLRAAENGRSMEAEARAILGAAVSGNRLVGSWLSAAAGISTSEVGADDRGAGEVGADDRGADDVELPVRSTPREVDLS